jgi:iron complex outermembrane recepter protein
MNTVTDEGVRPPVVNTNLHHGWTKTSTDLSTDLFPQTLFRFFRVFRVPLFLLIALAMSTRAMAGGADPRPPADLATGTITGIVRDRESLEPLGWTSVLLVELNRSTTAHEEGDFHFTRVPAGTYTLKAFRVGYQPLQLRLTLHANDSIDVMLAMTATAFVTESVVIEADSRSTERLVRPAVEISGRKLQQQLGRTLAETIDNEPGVAQRSMGPAPARPVLRGMGGDRLLILEDGARTGDLSATASDHAVAIDPMNAERIEIVRGPAALMYGANAMGGVVNVARGEIPTLRPDHVHDTASLQGETVNTGGAAGIELRVPAGPLALRGDASLRTTDDITTPAGVLRNTAIRTTGASLGASVPGAWGFAGASASTYTSTYGIPGGFVGAHPNGVDVDITRSQYGARAELLPASLVQRIELDASYARYYHEEREASGIIGARFGVLTANAGARAHHAAIGPFSRGSVGVWTQWRDFAASGFVTTPASVERAFALYGMEEIPLGDLTLVASLRGDIADVTPDTERASRVIGSISRRSFASFSGGLSAVYDLGAGISAGASLLRTSRAPALEELYSEGPHLAAYSYEIGNPALAMEHGIGLDLFARYEGENHRASVTLFRTGFTGYIYPRNTGTINFRTLLPLYQFAGGDALLTGAETMAEWLFSSHWNVALTASYVHGTLSATGTPLPQMPPLTGKVSLRYTRGALVLGASLRTATAQHRTGEFEQPTAGYAVVDLLAQYQLSTGLFLHTLVLVAENLLDTEYRVHLSRVRSVMPEPGRNVKLLYRVYF